MSDRDTYICPECGAERTDFEHEDGGYLPKCPNCQSTLKPFREAKPPRVLPPTDEVPGQRDRRYEPRGGWPWR